METQLQRIEQACRQFRVKALYVFGSRSAEVFQALQDDRLDILPSQSDRDIGVLTLPTLSVDEKVSLTLALEEIFDVQRVDLVLLQEEDVFWRQLLSVENASLQKIRISRMNMSCSCCAERAIWSSLSVNVWQRPCRTDSHVPWEDLETGRQRSASLGT